MKDSNYLHADLTYKIIGCAQAVHTELGPGFPENVYHRSFCIELGDMNVPFEAERSSDVAYKGHNVGQFRPDLVIDGKVIVELKALSGLNGEHLAQVLSYLKATRLPVGLLLNFGTKSLQTKRVVL